MTAYNAVTRNTRTGKEVSRSFDSAESAAAQLFVLMAADGWTESREKTVTRMVAGESLTHKRFEYSVTRREATE